MWEVNNNNFNLQMTEGDFGIDLPIKIKGATLSSSDSIKLIFKIKKDDTEPLIEKTYDNIEFNTLDPIYINHDIDSTFVHGKIHRRKYLLENDIRFNNSLTIHEDSYFNILAQNIGDNVKYCPTPFYLWKWRDESVCRHDPKYILKTYQNMLDSNDALVTEFNRRGMKDKARWYSVMMIFDAYYTMNKPEWINQENKKYRDETELKFAEYYNKHKIEWSSVSSTDKMQISNGVRSRSVMEGMQMESITIDDWLKHIMNLYNKNKKKKEK